MATCSRCTRTLPDDAAVCSFCGNKISRAETEQTKEDLLFHLRRSMKKEQAYWKNLGIALIVAELLLLAWAAWSFLRGNLPELIVSVCLLLLCIPGILVNLIQYGRVADEAEGIYLDCTPALERADDRKRALLSLFFNPPVFSVLSKSRSFVAEHRQALEELRKEQDRRYESTFRSDRLHTL